ncbi:MAG: dicarboxylate/amino acid:cation symporter [Desulfitobacterium hafniense]|nr:dicarboxylate/amino acid:cation symporter [Desulfitobacterium hafniense]
MKIGLLPRLLIGIAIGIGVGTWASAAQSFSVIKFLATFNSIFGNFLKYMVPFIIIGFVAPGIAELGRKASKMLGITTLIAYISSIGAGFLAFFAGAAILPSLINQGTASDPSEGLSAPFFQIAIPPMFDVMTALVTAFVLGLGMAAINSDALYKVLKDFQGIVELVIKKVIIPILPFHIAGTFANMASAGQIVATMNVFAGLFALLLGLQVVWILVQYLVAFAYTGKNPAIALKNMLPAYLTALGTQSSAATMPITLTSTRKNDIDEDIVDFVIPLCATIHLAGDVIALTIMSMGVMMMAGITPTLEMMLPFILMLGVMMVAAPGIPGGGVMASLGILENMLGFNPNQLTMMIALHLTQDSFGTATNVTGDGALALILNKLNKKTSKEPIDGML